jgi:anti-anti-sigma factor
MFHYRIIQGEPVTQAVFIGDMDIEATETIEEQITPELLKHRNINIDFSEVPFVDSSGIGLLITMIQQLKDAGIRVVITHLNPDVQEIFSLLQLPEIIGIDVFAE